ncbi:MAG: DNA modification methylase, partial [Planctomycetes bacterium]|nr:DNA modification methylase [Planctomycetota bacterium]
MQSKLSVEWVALDRLHPNPSNPRLNDAAVEHVAASLRRFGFQQPLVAQRSGVIVAGHTRYKAAKSLGMAEVPVAWFEGSETEAAAYGIADNRTHEYASWDEPALAKLLQGLRAEDALEGVGFTSEELDDLMARIDLETSGLLDGGEDDVPAPPDAATTRSGDLWVLGDHRLLCGDSSKEHDLDRLLGGQSIHLVHVDPPYNVRVEPRSNSAIAAGLSSFT